MKTISQIQQEVLATAQVTLDDFKPLSKNFGNRVGNVTRKPKEPVRLPSGTLTISQESFVIMLLIKTCTRKSCQANM